MPKPIDYLAAAVATEMRRTDSGPIDSLQAIREVFDADYNLNLTDEQADGIADRLQSLGLLQRIDDAYAGVYLVPSSIVAYKIGKLKDEGAASDFIYAFTGGQALFERAFKNGAFWNDFEAEIAVTGGESTESARDYTVPASDRTVTITHNQFKAIDEPADGLIEDLGRDNGIPDEPGLRDIILGQLRAGRELLRAGIFNLELFRMSMIAGLQLLIDRYRDKAIGEAASTLLTVILHELGLPGF